MLVALAVYDAPSDLIRTSIYDKYSGSTKISTHLDHISHYKTASIQIDRIVGPVRRIDGLKPQGTKQVHLRARGSRRLRRPQVIERV